MILNTFFNFLSMPEHIQIIIIMLIYLVDWVTPVSNLEGGECNGITQTHLSIFT